MKLKKGFLVISLLFILCGLFCPKVFALEKIITVNAEHTDIVAVLKTIAEQAGSNLVVSKNVIGIVTVNLKDVTLTQALDSVIKSNNYLYTFEEGIINVYSYEEVKQEERFSKIATRVYTLKYADVADLRRILLSMKSNRGRIELNEKANQVIVTDTQEKIEDIEVAISRLDQQAVLKKYRLLFAKPSDVKSKLQQVIPDAKGEIFVDDRTNSLVVKATPVILNDVDELISGWDVQSRQVLIEAKILQVTLDKNRKTGIDWQYLKGKYNLKGAFSQDITSGGIFQVGMMGRRDYQSVLELLEASSDTDVLSSPRIVVMDGKQASILVGSSEPYVVQQKDIDTGLITTETKFLDVGIKLKVTPSITEDGFVIMNIQPEVSSARRVAEVDNALAVDTTEADTTMMVKHGETVLLGGLIKDSNKLTTNKVPILGNIPLIGLFFRNDVKEKVKQELVVFITPHIIGTRGDDDILLEEAKRVEELTKRSMELREIVNSSTVKE
ncbi:MAG: secretin N-terminal domain-containing protein [Candidatus Omnitrophota bacterium]